MYINSHLLDSLICPISRKKLVYDAENERLISEEAGVYYPIEDGIPLILPEYAKKL